MQVNHVTQTASQHAFVSIVGLFIQLMLLALLMIQMIIEKGIHLDITEVDSTKTCFDTLVSESRWLNVPECARLIHVLFGVLNCSV